MTSHTCQCLSIHITYWFPRFLSALDMFLEPLGRRNVASLNTGGFVFPTFYGMMKIERW